MRKREYETEIVNKHYKGFYRNRSTNGSTLLESESVRERPRRSEKREVRYRVLSVSFEKHFESKLVPWEERTTTTDRREGVSSELDHRFRKGEEDVVGHGPPGKRSS